MKVRSLGLTVLLCMVGCSVEPTAVSSSTATTTNNNDEYVSPTVPNKPTMVIPQGKDLVTLLDEATQKIFRDRNINPQDALEDVVVVAGSATRTENIVTAEYRQQAQGRLYVRHEPGQGWLVGIPTADSGSYRFQDVPRSVLSPEELTRWLAEKPERVHLKLEPLTKEDRFIPLAAIAGLRVDHDDLQTFEVTAEPKPQGSWTMLTLTTRGRTLKVEIDGREQDGQWRPTLLAELESNPQRRSSPPSSLDKRSQRHA